MGIREDDFCDQNENARKNHGEHLWTLLHSHQWKEGRVFLLSHISKLRLSIQCLCCSSGKVQGHQDMNAQLRSIAKFTLQDPDGRDQSF